MLWLLTAAALLLLVATVNAHALPSRTNRQTSPETSSLQRRPFSTVDYKVYDSDHQSAPMLPRRGSSTSQLTNQDQVVNSQGWTQIPSTPTQHRAGGSEMRPSMVQVQVNSDHRRNLATIKRQPNVATRSQRLMTNLSETSQANIRIETLNSSESSPTDAPNSITTLRSIGSINYNKSPVTSESTKLVNGTSRRQNSNTPIRRKNSTVASTSNRREIANQPAAPQLIAGRIPLEHLGNPGAISSHREVEASSGKGAVSFVATTRDGTADPKGKDTGGDFVFPDSKFTPTVGCLNGTICESAVSYPKEYLNTVLKNDAGTFQSYFGKDEEKVTTRFGPLNPDDRQLCDSMVKVIFPKVGQTKDDRWLFIVNQGEFIQGVRIEVCRTEDSPCTFSKNFPQGYESGCKQKYIYRKLLGVNTEGQPEPDSFKLPSCCACYYRAIDVGNRISSQPKQ